MKTSRAPGFCSISTNFFLPTLVLCLLIQPRFIDASCTLRKNNTVARCHYLEDIKNLNPINLKSLTVITIGRHLSHDSFSNLKNLRHLGLSTGKLTKIEKGSFNGLLNLRSLDLSNNHLTHLGPGTLEGLKYLHLLNLSKNSLEEIPSDVVRLRGLKFLDLSRNNLNCDCKTLKTRDILLRRGIDTSKKTLCSGSHNLRGRPFIEPDAEAVCLFDERDLDEGMQMDQPPGELLEESSGEGSGDAFDDIQPEDIPEGDEMTEKQSTDIVQSTSTPVEVPLTPDSANPADDDEIFFSEESDQHSTQPPALKPAEATTELSKLSEVDEKKEKEWIEASGTEDLDETVNAEGSGLEGSGTGIVPPITWDGLDEDDDSEHPEEGIDGENVTTGSEQTTTTTESAGIIDSIYGFFWGPTEAPKKETSTSKDLNLEEEQFIPASSSPETPEAENSPVSEESIIPEVAKPVDTEIIEPRSQDDSQLSKVKVDVTDTGTESPDASAAKQSKKGMGSYVVLAILLCVLAALIGFAAYKGNFCRGGRKRHDSNEPDVENGTELKDLKKSLLENSNSIQPMISSNGNKPESVPLMMSPGEIKTLDEPTTKFVGAVNDALPDPVKPPRKSFSPNEIENGKKNGTNGKITTVPDLNDMDDGSVQCSRLPATKDALVNGKHDRDSLSSLGESPSLSSARLSSSRLSQGLPPASPGAQRVKITLQENPDSVPKTPLLITRTKAGENLVKTS